MKQLNHQSLSSSTTSLSTSNLPSSSSLTPASSDPKISEDISEQTETLIRTTLKNLLNKVQKEEITQYNDLEDAPPLDAINKCYRWALVRDLYNSAVDISGLTEAKRCFIGIICTYWLNNNQITKYDCVKGVSEYITLLEDVVIDVPKIYEWMAQMLCKLCSIFFGFELNFFAIVVLDSIRLINFFDFFSNNFFGFLFFH